MLHHNSFTAYLPATSLGLILVSGVCIAADAALQITVPSSRQRGRPKTKNKAISGKRKAKVKSGHMRQRDA
jgi:hypothetical protein